jgi:hypothetical protein
MIGHAMVSFSKLVKVHYTEEIDRVQFEQIIHIANAQWQIIQPNSMWYKLYNINYMLYNLYNKTVCCAIYTYMCVLVQFIQKISNEYVLTWRILEDIPSSKAAPAPTQSTPKTMHTKPIHTQPCSSAKVSFQGTDHTLSLFPFAISNSYRIAQSTCVLILFLGIIFNTQTTHPLP